MPDTIRTLAQLNAQFADNISGICSPQDVRDLMVSLMVHGEIGSGAKAAINLGTSYTLLDFTLAGIVSRGLNIDTVGKRINGIPVVMKAEVSFEMTFLGAVNTTFDFGVHVNGTLAARIVNSCRILAGATQIGLCTASSQIQLAAGDTIDLRGKSSAAAANNFTLTRGLLRVRRIGIE